MKTYFINEALDKAVNNYLVSKNNKEGILYNSFLVVVIRMLINIYGELDIVVPFNTKNELVFDTNLMKFGANKKLIDDLKLLIDGFYKIDLRNETSIRREDNYYFIEVQKKLIDLFDIKRLNFDVSDKEIKDFFDLLYTPGTSNPLRLSYNYLNAENIYEVAEYYKNKMAVSKEKPKEEKNLLNFDVYNYFNVSISDLSKMKKQEIDDLNNEIYKKLDVKDNAINKDYLLKEKINNLKSMSNPITTGNGYVDILFIMSIIVTVIMSVVIFTVFVF